MLECAMAETYKVYFVERDAQVSAVQFLTAENDEEALKAARALHGARMRDVWQGERHVGAIDFRPESEIPSASLWL